MLLTFPCKIGLLILIKLFFLDFPLVVNERIFLLVRFSQAYNRGGLITVLVFGIVGSEYHDHCHLKTFNLLFRKSGFPLNFSLQQLLDICFSVGTDNFLFSKSLEWLHLNIYSVISEYISHWSVNPWAKRSHLYKCTKKRP